MIKPNWILQRTKLSPNKIALINVHTNKQWTYADLEREIYKWVGYFQNKYQKGDRIAILSRNRKELFPIIFACSIVGLIYVPFNWRLSIREIRKLLENCGASIILYEKQFETMIAKVTSIDKVNMDEVPNNGRKIIASENVSSEAAWMMIYTGGTTGEPKGVVLSHEAVNTNAVNTIVSWGLNEEDKTINYMPLFHTGGINALSIPILMAGGTIVIGDNFDANEALHATDEYAATISLFVPTMYQQMIDTDYFNTSTFPSMRVFLSGGAPCPQNIYKSFQERGLNFKEGYGLTEAGPNNFFIRPEIAMHKIGSVGKSMLFNEVMLSSEDRTPCAANEVGELYIKGNHLFTSYWNNKRATEAVFDGEWFRTGDLAKFDEEGDYYIVGRKKDMIITGGENVFPQEVEQCLLNYETVKEVAVIGVPDHKWGEKVVAFLTIDHTSEFNEDLLINYCKKNLGKFKVPKQFQLLDELPKTDVGKIDKNKLLKKLIGSETS